MSANLPFGEGQETVRAVRVEAIFHVAEDRQAQAVAARMIDSAHQIANLPECECDVDVSIQRVPLGAVTDPSDLHVSAQGHPAKL